MGRILDGGYILIGPNGPSVDKPGPVILDTNGELVWMTDEWGLIMNLNVQQYKGR